MRLAYNLGEVWSEDLMHQGYGGLHVICRFFWPVRIALITMPGKAFRCDKQWHFERLKQMSLVQLKRKRPCPTIKWGIPTRLVKMILLGFKVFIFRGVVGCNAQKRLILFFQKSCDLIDDLIDLGRIRRGNGLLCKSPWKKTMRKRRLHILAVLHSFPTENWRLAHLKIYPNWFQKGNHPPKLAIFGVQSPLVDSGV